MLIYFDRNRRFFLVLCVVFLLVAGAAVHSGAFEDGRGEVLRLYVENLPGESEEEAVVYVCADRPLYEISRGGAVALGLTLELAEGWSCGEVIACGGTEGMTVTVGENENSLHILLDGRPPRGDDAQGGRLLQVAVSSSGSTPLSVRIHADGGCYYINENGEICSCPISAEVEMTESVSEESVPEPQESTAPRDDTTAETDFSQETETFFVTDTKVETQPETKPTAATGTGEVCGLPSAYVGCQETPVRDGGYAVRLLFLGEVPAIWVEGGGYLTFEITWIHSVEACEDGKIREYAGEWSVCTFRGLRAKGRYTFFVETEQGTVGLFYENGRFLGDHTNH